jgi:drug/metabolite transporter (DMT)-like permease
VQTLAFRYEKAGRVAPFLYLQILFCCLADIVLFGTRLGYWQVMGGLVILTTNFTIAMLKAVNYIK